MMKGLTTVTVVVVVVVDIICELDKDDDSYLPSLQWQMSRNAKWAGVELAISLMIQIQQNYTSLYSSSSNT